MLEKKFANLFFLWIAVQFLQKSYILPVSGNHLLDQCYISFKLVQFCKFQMLQIILKLCQKISRFLMDWRFNKVFSSKCRVFNSLNSKFTDFCSFSRERNFYFFIWFSYLLYDCKNQNIIFLYVTHCFSILPSFKIFNILVRDFSWTQPNVNLSSYLRQLVTCVKKQKYSKFLLVCRGVDDLRSEMETQLQWKHTSQRFVLLDERGPAIQQHDNSVSQPQTGQNHMVLFAFSQNKQKSEQNLFEIERMKSRVVSKLFYCGIFICHFASKIDRHFWAFFQCYAWRNLFNADQTSRTPQN